MCINFLRVTSLPGWQRLTRGTLVCQSLVARLSTCVRTLGVLVYGTRIKAPRPVGPERTPDECLYGRLMSACIYLMLTLYEKSASSLCTCILTLIIMATRCSAPYGRGVNAIAERRAL